MDNDELLQKVKSGLSISGTYNDSTLTIKTMAVKAYMENAGILAEQVVSDLGIVTLTVGVNDLWNLSSGEVQFSPAFHMLMTQLEAVSMPDVQT